MASPFQKLARFRSEWCVDFEFYQEPQCINRVSYTDKYGEPHTDTGNIPVPVALTAYERRTRTKICLGYDELHRCKTPPYPIGPADLFISYYGTAELGCHLALGWPRPRNVRATYPEFRRVHTYPRSNPANHFCEYGVTRLYEPPDPFPYPPKYVPELDDFDPDKSQSFGLLAAR